MQLDCKRHAISGVRADSRCYKCSPRLEKKNPVDSQKSIGPSMHSGTQGWQSVGPLATRDSSATGDVAALPLEPVAQSVATRTNARTDSAGFGERSDSHADATQLQQLGVTQGEVFLRHFGFAGAAGLEQYARCLRRGIERAKAELAGLRGAA